MVRQMNRVRHIGLVESGVNLNLSWTDVGANTVVRGGRMSFQKEARAG